MSKRGLEPTRRAAIAGGVGALAALGADAQAQTRRRPPNFLFIMADDMGYADLSCYGRSDYATPEIDALAAQGMKFTSAYANSAVCTATRVALITGRYQYRLPIGLEEPLGARPVGLSPEHPTIASLLRAQGYATSLIGKWHLGALPNYGPLQSGYDHFWGLRGGGVDYFTHASSSGEGDLWDGDTRIEESGYLTDLLADRTIETLQSYRREGRPWFISLHFTAPHWPWEGPEDEEESRRIAAIGQRIALQHYDGGSAETYAAMMRRMDFQVGRILRELRRLRMDRDTVVVFTSDNGGERFSDVWPFSGRKTELLEGGIRVPAIVRWPGVARPGSESDAQIMSMDWLPTFVHAAGGNLDDARFDGQDVGSAVAGEPLPERTLYWRYRNHGQEAVRRGRWKYLKIADNTFLFDVVADPMERANLKDRMPEVFSELQAVWTAWNETMLPLDPQANTHGFTGARLADHFGVGE